MCVGSLFRPQAEIFKESGGRGKRAVILEGDELARAAQPKFELDATNAQAALRWLAARPPNLEEVRQALDHIVKDASRAGDVIGRIREIIKKAPSRKDRVDINEAIREVIELTRGEAAKHGAAVQTAFGMNGPGTSARP